MKKINCVNDGRMSVDITVFDDDVKLSFDGKTLTIELEGIVSGVEAEAPKPKKSKKPKWSK